MRSQRRVGAWEASQGGRGPALLQGGRRIVNRCSLAPPEAITAPETALATGLVSARSEPGLV